jgi:hypothetical protein
MSKVVRHIAAEIVAAKPKLDGCTHAKKLVKKEKEIFPKLAMNKFNYT